MHKSIRFKKKENQLLNIWFKNMKVRHKCHQMHRRMN